MVEELGHKPHMVPVTGTWATSRLGRYTVQGGKQVSHYLISAMGKGVVLAGATAAEGRKEEMVR